MNNININTIKEFSNIFQFSREVDNKDIKLHINSKNIKNFKEFNWLYISFEEEMKLVGIKNNIVYAIDTNGFLIELCEGIENIPYEILRIQSYYADNELVSNLFNNDNVLLTELLKYEDWCKNNGINLDIQKVYHDSNGILFTKYFEK